MDNIDLCNVHFVDQPKVGSILKEMLPDQIFRNLADTFKILDDPNRIKIIFSLSKQELCVCDIANLLGISPSAVSHQLRMLRALKIVKYRREGKMAYYSLSDEHVKTILFEAIKHIECH